VWTLFFLFDFNKPSWLFLETIASTGIKLYSILRTSLLVSCQINIEQSAGHLYSTLNSFNIEQVTLIELSSFIQTTFNGCLDFFTVSVKPFYNVLVTNANIYLSFPYSLDLTKFLTNLFSPKIFYNTGLNVAVTSQLSSVKLTAFNFLNNELYGTVPFENQPIFDKNTFNFQEQRSDYRYQRLQLPILRYDFKLGNYMPDEKKKKVFFFVHYFTWYNYRSKKACLI
jgi:hypothetical protein